MTDLVSAGIFSLKKKLNKMFHIFETRHLVTGDDVGMSDIK